MIKGRFTRMREMPITKAGAFRRAPNLMIILLAMAIILSTAADSTAVACWPVLNGIQNMVGEVTRIAMKNNRLIIKDERSRRPFRFFAPTGKLASLRTGERVRVYYRCGQDLIVSVKKMTPVAYKKDGQNLGFIFADRRNEIK